MSKRILVVEDQEDNRQILRDLLANAGYEMIEAQNGEAAPAATQTPRPALILMYIQIIVVPAYALSGDEEKARAAGCDAYVAKPYSARKLLETINLYLT